MESQKIHILLQKYFDAETTIDEENELITYFTSSDVDESLKMYVPMFSGLKELSADEDADLSDDLMNHILESEHKEKLHYRWMWQAVTGIAAAVIVALLAVNFYGNRNDYKDTFSDPQQAYVEAVKTLQFVSGKYHQGLAQLKPMKKIDNAVSPLKSGISKVNKGFKQMDEVTNLNKKLKKE
jgi:predicted membrane-bound mannosyltransferase